MKEVELPDGRIAEFPDSMSNAQIEAVLREQFPPQPQPAQEVNPLTAGPSLAGAGQLGLSALTGMVAQPVAGLAGIAATTFGSDQAGTITRNVENMLTSDLGPEGIATAGAMLDAVPKPLQSALGAAVQGFEGFADLAAETFGPVAGAAVKTAPTAAAELAGFKGGSAAARSLLKTTDKAIRMGKGGMVRTMRQMVPDADTLHGAARAVWAELDDQGVRLSSKAAGDLSKKMALKAAKGGRRFGKDVLLEATDLAQRAAQGDVPIQDILDLRQAMKRVATGPNPAAASAGGAVNAIDEFLDGLTAGQMIGPRGMTIGLKARTARELHRRTKRLESLDLAIENARTHQSGIEGGIRQEFKNILKRKESRFFTEAEKEAMRQVTEGSGNFHAILRGLGKLGWNERHGFGLLSYLTGGGALMSFGPEAAVAVPLIGGVSRKLSTMLTQRNAELAQAVVKAGRNGQEIVSAYKRLVPRSSRDPQHLAQLLLRPDVDLNFLDRDALVQQARAFATMDRQRLAALSTAAAAGSGSAATQQE